MRHFERVGDITILFLPPFAVFCIAVMEWLHYFLKLPPSPWVPTIAFPIFSLIAFVRGRRIWREMERTGLGVKGERVVGQMLEALRADGYDVYHDIPGEGFNVDHVVVGPGGVFAIETKTYSKPAAGRASVVFDGKQLTVNGHVPDRDPIAQSEAAAGSVRKILRDYTGRDVQVRPVVLFPGWYVEKMRPEERVTVMNAEYFVRWMTGRAAVLPANDAALLSAGLARYLRDKRR